MSEDQKRALMSVERLPEQFLQAWEESSRINFAPQYSTAENVVICGMGASGLPGHIITGLYPPKVPIVLVSDYYIPAWAGLKTLVFLSSYSGNTEETISCFQEAKARGCLITGTTTGGRLANLFETEGVSFYKYAPKHNPSGQPRFGLGYGIFGQMGILHKLGVLAGADTLGIDITRGTEALRALEGQIKDSAQEIAQSSKGNIVLVLAGEHLAGNAHAFANQLNETAKNLASWHALPEANHHLLEGLKNPKAPVLAILFDSNNYSDEIKKRLILTKDIIKKNGHKIYVYTPGQASKLNEIMEVLCLSSYSTTLLAELSGENPLAIPWVDYFKQKLTN